jgi:hypothetical protein
MWRRQNDGEIQEAFELHPDMEIVNGHETANNSRTIDEKTGNAQDRRDMTRLGKSQELRVSRYRRQQYLQFPDQMVTEALQSETSVRFCRDS